MDIARSVAALLTWQWLILILALIFRWPLHRLFDRIVDFRLGGEKGIQVSAPIRNLEIDTGRVADVGTPNFQDRVDTKLIVLRDNEGRERAKLGVTDKNAVAFTMNGSNGKERMRLVDNGNGTATSLSFLSDSGKTTALLAGGPTAGLSFSADANGLAHAIFVVGEKQQFLQIADGEGKTIFSAP
jgi:hypothetical protein